MNTLEENLAIIVHRFGLVMISERVYCKPGWCISDGGGSEVCADTVAAAAAKFVVLYCTTTHRPLEYPRMSE